MPQNPPICFWKPHEVPYGYLSQWYPSHFTVPASESSQEGITFNTAEQYMMYHKALLFNDHSTASRILKTKEPRRQKALGRRISNFDDETWDANKERIVEEGNWWKFTNGAAREGLKQKLLYTGERELVEASTFDRIWGIGFKSEDINVVNREEWGQNLLGKAIMRVRDRIRKEEQEKAEAEHGEGS